MILFTDPKTRWHIFVCRTFDSQAISFVKLVRSVAGKIGIGGFRGKSPQTVFDISRNRKCSSKSRQTWKRNIWDCRTRVLARYRQSSIYVTSISVIRYLLHELCYHNFKILHQKWRLSKKKWKISTCVEFKSHLIGPRNVGISICAQIWLEPDAEYRGSPEFSKPFNIFLEIET